jgi:hypothetical protein
LLIYRPGFLKREKHDRFWENVAAKIVPDSYMVDLPRFSKLMIDESFKCLDDLRKQPNISAVEPTSNTITLNYI